MKHLEKHIPLRFGNYIVDLYRVFVAFKLRKYVKSICIDSQPKSQCTSIYLLIFVTPAIRCRLPVAGSLWYTAGPFEE